jgi:dTDP-glucose 4,6-dehydratase
MKAMARVMLVAGAAGFIGSNFTRYWSECHPSDDIIALDLLTYAGNKDNLRDLGPRIKFIRCDIGDTEAMTAVLQDNSVDMVVNFAAESHNSLAVSQPHKFFNTNVMATVGLLEAIRRRGVGRFHHISSSEVYGDIPAGQAAPFSEGAAYRPPTIYGASKASADHAIRAYTSMYSIPATIGVSCNNYGPFQFPEKIIPLFTANALQGHPLPLYSSIKNSREYIHVSDHCAAIDAILHRGQVGETYNIGSGVEVTIDEIADLILRSLDLPSSLKETVPDRPMHSRRHALDSTKIRADLGWASKISFEQGLHDTLRWYQRNVDWWREAMRRRQVEENSW